MLHVFFLFFLCCSQFSLSTCLLSAQTPEKKTCELVAEAAASENVRIDDEKRKRALFLSPAEKKTRNQLAKYSCYYTYYFIVVVVIIIIMKLHGSWMRLDFLIPYVSIFLEIVTTKLIQIWAKGRGMQSDYAPIMQNIKS